MTNPFSSSNPILPGSGPIRRWILVWAVIEYLMLVVSTALVLLDNTLSPTIHLLAGGFGLAFGLWYWFFPLSLSRWGRQSPILVITFIIVIAGLGGMTLINGFYYWMLFSLSGVVFSVLEIRLAVPLTIYLGLLGTFSIIQNNHMTLPQAGGVIVAFVIGTFLSVILGLYITAIITQSSERQHMLTELQAARDDLARAERQAGVLEERQRLAREIHDTLAQGFTSVVMHLEAAEAAMPPGSVGSEPSNTAIGLDTVRLHLDRARATARESLAEARRFVWALRTEPLEQHSLSEAIQRVTARWEEESSLKTRFEITGVERSLPPEYEVTLLRAVQEALANIRKHAQASQVTLTLTYMDDQVILDVQDDGQGFDPLAQPLEIIPGERPAESHGYGLVGLRERVQALGGSLTLESAPGEGTALALVLPNLAAPGKGDL